VPEWREFDQSVPRELRERDFVLRPDGRSTQETIEIVQASITTDSPIARLSGDATTTLVLMTTTLGGASVLAGLFGYSVLTQSRFRQQFNRLEPAESRG
jgi:hypothetical protein